MNTKRRQLLSLVWVLALVASALAQQAKPQSTPSVDRLQQIISYLASDALEGRRTGTAGADGAARYIAGEFSRYGLRPGMQVARAARTRGESQSRYLQPFPYVAGVKLAGNNLFFINPGKADDIASFRVGEDWMPLGFSTNASIKGAEMIFAGYGISSAELKYDDYALANVKDRVAVVFAGTPDGETPHSQFLRAGEIRFRAAAARAAGARALLIIEEAIKDERLWKLSYDNAGEAGIPVVVISRKLGAKILGKELSFYEQIADARKPSERIPFAGIKLDLTTEVNRRLAPSFNVVGILPGSDPKLKNEAIVIGAHYDHLGLGGQGSLAPRAGEIHHGADDNASGTAGLIELARMLSSQNPKPRRTIVFIAFSGEEEGLIGSNYYVNNSVVPLQNTVAMINMDMIGRMKERKLVIGGVGTAQEWRSMLDAHNLVQSTTVTINPTGSDQKSPGTNRPLVVGANGQPVVTVDPTKQFALTLTEDGFGPSDHSAFYAKQIPVLFFWTGTHDDYHKPSDTADKINYQGEAQIVGFAASLIRDIDKSDKRPTYAVAKSESQGRSAGFRIYLGTIPTYGDASDGLKLDGVRDDSPAAKAGLKAGDKIVKMAGRDIKNVYDYTYALGEMKAGQEYEVVVMRGSERLTLRITPAARK
jgi:hypothetical protein